MTHAYIPTLPTIRDTRAAYKPRHRGHALEVPPDSPPLARCTGGLKNVYGKRLTNCRSRACPAHTPDGYARYGAKHDRDLTIAEARENNCWLGLSPEQVGTLVDFRL